MSLQCCVLGNNFDCVFVVLFGCHALDKHQKAPAVHGGLILLSFDAVFANFPVTLVDSSIPH